MTLGEDSASVQARAAPARSSSAHPRGPESRGLGCDARPAVGSCVSEAREWPRLSAPPPAPARDAEGRECKCRILSERVSVGKGHLITPGAVTCVPQTGVMCQELF